MDRRTVPYATLTHAIKQFAARHRNQSRDLIPCYAATKAYHSNHSGLRAVPLEDGSYRICNSDLRKH